MQVYSTERYEVNKPSRDATEKYLTGMKRKAERDGNNKTNENHLRVQMKKYDDIYVALGFSVTTVGLMQQKIIEKHCFPDRKHMMKMVEKLLKSRQWPDFHCTS